LRATRRIPFSAVALAPSFRLTQATLARLLAAMGRWDEALGPLEAVTATADG